MSFNKCFISQEKILKIYNESNSIERVRKYLNAYDSFFCKDEFSSNLIKVYYKLEDEEL